MAGIKEFLMEKLRKHGDLSGREQFKLTLLLSLPSIFAQLSMCLMSYIDAAMVGRLGSLQAAAIGLVSTTTWIFGSFCYANSSGFSVQVAHRCGASQFDSARGIASRGLVTVLGFSILLSLLALSISSSLPAWLGGSADIQEEATLYFRIYALFLPIFQIAVFCEAALIASGNVKVPSLVSLVMCLLDVAFNYLFIFVMDMGVRGAALGTGLATGCAAVFLVIYMGGFCPELKRFYRFFERGEARNEILRRALDITWPLWLQNLISRGAYIAATILVAPLGTIAIAANSFAIIAEGFCYLPGYGMADAATTLVGQSLGGKHEKMARRFAWMTIATGAAMMTFLAVLMWVFAPQIMSMLSNDHEVISLGAKCLRIEAWAELLYGVSIVAYGCCVGAGDTLIPSAINLLSMWVIRIGLALVLIPRMGLEGYWYAMAIELSVKGLIFAVRIRGNKWMRTKLTLAG